LAVTFVTFGIFLLGLLFIVLVVCHLLSNAQVMLDKFNHVLICCR